MHWDWARARADEWSTTFGSGTVPGSEWIVTSVVKRFDWVVRDVLGGSGSGLLLPSSSQQQPSSPFQSQSPSQSPSQPWKDVALAPCHESCGRVAGARLSNPDDATLAEWMRGYDGESRERVQGPE